MIKNFLFSHLEFYKILKSWKIKYLLSILSGLLYSIPWLFKGSSLILFISIVPLLFIEKHTSSYSLLVKYIYCFFASWLLATTLWLPLSGLNIIHYTILVVFFSLSQTIVFSLGIFFARQPYVSELSKYSLIVGFWLLFEYIQKKWLFSNSIAIIGSGLSDFPEIIQWYEYVGILGGSTWILIINLTVFYILQRPLELKPFVFLFFWIAVPCTSSFIVFRKYDSTAFNTVKVATINPRIKTTTNDMEAFYKHILNSDAKYTLEALKSNPDIILWQEGAIDGEHFEDLLNKSDETINYIQSLISGHRDASLLTGIKITNSVHGQAKDRWLNRKIYNGLIYIDNQNLSGQYPFKIKKRLVPFGEYVPFKSIVQQNLPAFSTVIPKIDKILHYHYSSEDNKGEGFFKNEKVKFGALICYESLFSEEAAQAVKSGAEILFVLSDESLYVSKIGTKQLTSQLALRAIETRRDIVKSCNFGSCSFVALNGRVKKTQEYNVEGEMVNESNLNQDFTFYTSYLKVIDSSFLSFLILGLLLLIKDWQKNRNISQ